MNDEKRVPAASGDVFIPSTPQIPEPAAVPLKLTVKQLKKAVATLHFANDGDSHERQYWPITNERFPNCERFWQPFVVPLTKRVERQHDDPGRIGRRGGVADDIWHVSYLSYSLFLHLTAAFDHLSGPLNGSFSDFYSHLGSACDLAEEFLLRCYFIVAECTGKVIPILQQLSKSEFLKLAEAWYEDHYPNVYEHYLKYGKGKPPINLPAQKNVIDQYFTGGNEWPEYKSFSQKLRTYRNRIVHDVAIGNVMVGKVHLVPRKERIQDYRSLQAVELAAKDVRRLKKDFIVREEQMSNDMLQIQQHLNALWERPISDFGRLLYKDKNPAIMAKYNLLLR